jgi:hypothetical protein
MTCGRILFAVACLFSFPAFADDLIGQAIIDGDTLEIHGTRICRLAHNGRAPDWPQYSKGKYDKAQRDRSCGARDMGRQSPPDVSFGAQIGLSASLNL